MLDLAGNVSQFTIEIEGVDADLGVLRFRAREGLSQLFTFHVDLAADDAEIDLSAAIGSTAVMTIEGDDGPRYFHGIVSRFEQVGATPSYALYRATVVPWVWRMMYRQDSRIFQTKAVPDIIKEVFEAAGLASDAFKIDAQGTHPEREYCVQYRESDWAFVCRLMEEEGLFYYFEHSEDDHLLVLSDSIDIHESISGTPGVRFQPHSGQTATEDAIVNLTYSRQLRTGKVTLRDFNFKKPSLNLETENEAADDPDLEWYDYPGGYDDGSVGSAFAQVRTEERQTFLETIEGDSTCNRLTAGYTFDLTHHPRADLNQTWLIVRTEHVGSQPQTVKRDATGGETTYQTHFSAISAEVPFRPPRVTPRPTVRGVQTAIVVGPSGEEIHTDEHGRVKVQFHWDRVGANDENSSCWIRVSQLWAGLGWGAMWIPRIGHEVIVDFLEGDPDRPIITGRVYHGENPPPYELPAEKTKSTIKSESSLGGGGFNEIRFEDAKDAEEIYVHGQKDWTIAIENDKNQTVGHDETLQVGNDRSKTIGNDQTQNIGNDKTESVGNNKTVSVGTDHTETIGSNRTETIGKNLVFTVGISTTESVGANKAESIGGAKELTVGGAYAVTIGGVMSESVGKDQSVDVGKNKTEQIKENLTLKVGKKILIDGGDEIVLKSGKASIILKKNGDITIEAGGKLTMTSKKDTTAKASGNMVLKGKKISEN